MNQQPPDRLLRSFERYLRATNRSERTVGNYLENLHQVEAFLHPRGVRLRDATRADLEDFLADLLAHRSAATRYKVLRVEALMQHRSYPTRPPTPTPPAGPPFALHLLHGWWVASCPECRHELGRSRDQEAAEHAGERRRCPICRPERPDRHARLAFLVAWLTANGLDHEEAG